MGTNVEWIRTNIKAQGFCDLDDAAYTQFNYPLRLAPAICMAWTAVGTFLASPAILWALTPFALLGALLPGHPFDVLYNYVWRHVRGKPPLPRYPFRRRFACALATAMLVTAAVAFQTGHRLAGSVMGWFLVAAAFVNVTTGFCIPSFLVRLVAGPVE